MDRQNSSFDFLEPSFDFGKNSSLTSLIIKCKNLSKFQQFPGKKWQTAQVPNILCPKQQQMTPQPLHTADLQLWKTLSSPQHRRRHWWCRHWCHAAPWQPMKWCQHCQRHQQCRVTDDDRFVLLCHTNQYSRWFDHKCLAEVTQKCATLST